MSNYKKIIGKIENSSQPIIVIDQSGGWDQYVDSIVADLEISPADLVCFSPEDGVKGLREKLSILNLKPHSSRVRLFVIFDTEKLNREQINTLLKTLEEPPEYCRTILFARNILSVLPTVKSRCKKITIASSSRTEGEGLLSYFEHPNFNSFLSKLGQVENDSIPGLIEETLEEMKNKLLNKDTLPLYKKLSQNLISVSTTNVNRKLVLEGTFLWWKARFEK